MESVILIAPRGYGDALRSRLENLVGPSVSGVEGIVIDDGVTRVYVARNDLVPGECEPELLARIRTLAPEPVFYTVDFSDIRLCRKVLEVLVDDPEILVDNDHGVLLRGPEFLELLRSRPDWDWRT